MSKAKIIDKKSVESILGEKNILSILHHPFIVNMVFSFQDNEYLYLVMDLLPGGNLRYHISIKKYFDEKQTKFLIACILVGLEYIHSMKILHRDIKPENLVFDLNGYLRITDFGIAKKYTINNKKDTSGTVGYLAPEVLCNENHTFSIDYYAVGIITYELAYGHRPYIGRNKHEVKQLILTKQAQIEYDELPDDFHNEAADFINKLIQRKPKNRLGKNNIYELINHPWFLGFDWTNLKLKISKAPYVIKNGDNFDKKYCLGSNQIGTETIERYEEIMQNPNYNVVFKNFNCDKIPEEFLITNIKSKNDNLINVVSDNDSTSCISRNNNKNNLYQIQQQSQGLMFKDNNIINKNKKNILHEIINHNQSLNNDLYNKFLFKNKDRNYLFSISDISKIRGPKDEKIENNEKQKNTKYILKKNSNIKNSIISNLKLNNKMNISNSLSNIQSKKLIFTGIKKLNDNLNNIIQHNIKINKLNGCNSTNDLLKKNNLIANYNNINNQNKKSFIKREILNGTFFEKNKISNFTPKLKKRKSSSSNLDNNSKSNSIKRNKRLKSSHSTYNLSKEINELKAIFKQNSNLINHKNKMKIINAKKFPFISVSLSKGKKNYFGNEVMNSGFSGNGYYDAQMFLNEDEDAFLSERIKKKGYNYNKNDRK